MYRPGRVPFDAARSLLLVHHVDGENPAAAQVREAGFGLASGSLTIHREQESAPDGCALMLFPYSSPR